MKRKKDADPCCIYLVPPEIQTEILSKLPVKSLLRFKCVQKSWRNIIETPSFINLHLNSFCKNNVFLLCDSKSSSKQYFRQSYKTENKNNTLIVECGSNEILMPSASRLFGKSPAYIVASSNGLVCLSHHQVKTNVAALNQLDINIWNPSTRKIMKLPRCYWSKFGGKFHCGVIGFGFCPKLNDYKVIKVISYTNSNQAKAQVYSLSTDSWKNITLPHPGWNLVAALQRHGFINGIFYWIAQKIGGGMLLLGFEFDEEVIVKISMPDSFDFYGNWNISIAEYRNLVSLVTNEFRLSNVLQVWVMKEYGVADSWVKQFTIELAMPRIRVLKMRPIFVDFENDGELALVLDRNDRRIIWCNTKTNQIEKELKFLYPIYEAIRCKENLVSLPRESRTHALLE